MAYTVEKLLEPTPPPTSKRGGARPGAGRPKKTVPDVPTEIGEELTMLELLRRIALGRVKVTAAQLTAARAAVQYEQVKAGDGGKKDEAQAQAAAAHDDLPQTPAPKLQAVP